MQQNSFQIVVNGVPYMVKATPFSFNDETRFRVSYNGGDEHIFTFDPSVGRLSPIGDDASTMPDDLERAIAGKLQGGRFSQA